MSMPLQLTFRNTDRSEWMEEAVEAELKKLERFSDQIQHCRVLIEKLNNHHHKGNVYHVRVSITVEGKEIIVSKESRSESAGRDVHTALKHAFEVIPRKLESLESFHPRHRKKREYFTRIEHGQVARVFTEEGFGFLQTSDGNEVYFDRNVLVGLSIDQLLPGADVAFASEAGSDGPLVSWVSAIT